MADNIYIEVQCLNRIFIHLTYHYKVMSRSVGLCLVPNVLVGIEIIITQNRHMYIQFLFVGFTRLARTKYGNAKKIYIKTHIKVFLRKILKSFN